METTDSVRRWLKAKCLKQAMLSGAGGVLLVVPGTLFIIATFWVIYAALWFSVSRFLPVDHTLRLVFSAIGILLLFWGYSRTTEEEIHSFSFSSGTASPEMVVFYLPKIGVVSTMNPLAPDSMYSGIKMVTTFLYMGPRFFAQVPGIIRKVKALMAMNHGECAKVLALLLSKDERFSFQEICQQIPTIDPTVLFPQLLILDGILLLESEPPGFKLSSEMREEMVNAIGS